MKKIFKLFLGAFTWAECLIANAADKYDILPDLPEPLATAQASSITTTTDNINVATQSVGSEPNFLSVTFSLVFVILLIYATGIIYTKLNKVNLKTLKHQVDDLNNSKVSVISTTILGNNKTLHIVELDGKRMLIGASQNGIHLIKDLGNYPPKDFEEGEYSKIEIPNIRIPKIEIPKIEFPNIGFTRTVKKDVLQNETNVNVIDTDETLNSNNDEFQISEIYEESSDGIIDKLFIKNESSNNEVVEKDIVKTTHSVDPEEFLLYKKYL